MKENAVVKPVPFYEVTLKEGFWKDRFDLNKEVSVEAVYRQFEQTGRFDALRFLPKSEKEIHFYYDSDVAKWIEAVAYLIKGGHDMSRYEKIIDELVDDMAKNQLPDGYLNSYFQQKSPDKIFTDRDMHELYCAGHLIEAAIAYDDATHKHKFLALMEDYANLICKVFVEEKSAPFTTSGHAEIETAMFRLYRYTGNERYFDACKYFLFERHKGVTPCRDFANNKYDQCDASVYELEKAEGHAVRAVYLYRAMAQTALETGDGKLKAALDRLFADMETKTYITGGIGSASVGESFTVPYDLPNLTAYSESCAAIGLLLLCNEMEKFSLDSRYADLAERIMYNALLSSTSLDGKKFFYENPLEIRRKEVGKETSVTEKFRTRLPINERVEGFRCSCCPPNINRIFAMLPEFLYGEHNGALVIRQYVSSSVNDINVQTDYPVSGRVKITGKGYSAKSIYLRKPAWAERARILLNGKETSCEIANGYLNVTVGDFFEIELSFSMKAKFVYANPKVSDDVGRVALTFGPVVYAIESKDNGEELNALTVKVNAKAETYLNVNYNIYDIYVKGYRESAEQVYSFEPPVREEITLRFVPYFTFANRGGDTLVWVRRS